MPECQNMESQAVNFAKFHHFAGRRIHLLLFRLGFLFFPLSKGLLFVEVTEVSKIIIWCYFFHYSVIYSYIKSKTKTLKQTFLHIELLTE